MVRYKDLIPPAVVFRVICGLFLLFRLVVFTHISVLPLGNVFGRRLLFFFTYPLFKKAPDDRAS